MEKFRFNEKSGDPTFDNTARVLNLIALSAARSWTLPKGRLPRKAKKLYLENLREYAIRLWIADIAGSFERPDLDARLQESIAELEGTDE